MPPVIVDLLNFIANCMSRGGGHPKELESYFSKRQTNQEMIRLSISTQQYCFCISHILCCCLIVLSVFWLFSVSGSYSLFFDGCVPFSWHYPGLASKIQNPPILASLGGYVPYIYCHDKCINYGTPLRNSRKNVWPAFPRRQNGTPVKMYGVFRGHPPGYTLVGGWVCCYFQGEYLAK